MAQASRLLSPLCQVFGCPLGVTIPCPASWSIPGDRQPAAGTRAPRQHPGVQPKVGPKGQHRWARGCPPIAPQGARGGHQGLILPLPVPSPSEGDWQQMWKGRSWKSLLQTGSRSASPAPHHPPAARPRVNTRRLQRIPALGPGWGLQPRAPVPTGSPRVQPRCRVLTQGCRTRPRCGPGHIWGLLEVPAGSPGKGLAGAAVCSMRPG